MQRSNLTLMNVFDLQAAIELQAAPGGSWLTYTRLRSDIKADRPTMQLWRMNTDGSGHAPLTGSTANESSARISPDGTRVAYISHESGSPQIHVLEIATGTSACLTNLASAPSLPSWSPDSQWIAYFTAVPKLPLDFAAITTAPPGCSWAEPPYLTDALPYKLDKVGFLPRATIQLQMVHAAGGSSLALTEEELGLGVTALAPQNPVWTADGREILILGNTKPEGMLAGRYSDVLSIDVGREREPRNLTNFDGLITAMGLSPDGTKIAFAGAVEHRAAHPHNQAYLLDRESTELTEIAHSLDRSVAESLDNAGAPIVWEPDSSAFLALYSDHGDTKLGRFGVDGSHTIVIEGVSAGISAYPMGAGFARIGPDALVYHRAVGGEFPELYVQEKGESPRQLTWLNESLRRSHQLSEFEELWVTNPDDGTRLHCWVVKPGDFDAAKRYPLILDIHGGPHADYGNRFWLKTHAMAGAGYCVLLVNPRGSTSYGYEFTRGIEYTYPGEDCNDLLAAVDEVAARPYIDEDNLFVTGGSGGGVLTAALIGLTDRFRAAAALYPVIEWTSFMLSADITPLMRFWFEKMPWEDPPSYAQRSLIRNVAKISTPTLVMCGADDHRTPFGQAEIFYQALKFAGVETVLARFPGEPHGIAARPGHHVQSIELVLNWFAKHAR